MTVPTANAFAAQLYEEMRHLDAAIEDLELYEFRYALHHLTPAGGNWTGVALDEPAVIERQIDSLDFYRGIRLKPRMGEQIVLDSAIVRLARMLFVGLVAGSYTIDWVRAHFYFDVRGFFFLPRTVYFTTPVLAHLGGAPFCRFEPRQEQLERCQSIGYRSFKQANAEIDAAFVEATHRLVAARGTPLVLALAGPTAAGKTEIVELLRASFEQAGHSVTSIEMDNFLTDRDYREEKGIHTLGKEAIHLSLFRQGLADLCRGQAIRIPRYDFVAATSSHDREGRLKPGCTPIDIEPAGLIFVEGNFPFLLAEVAPLIDVKVVYLTDDAIRLKRKWRRDIDYRKKYEPVYLQNRFFREQYLMAHACYRPQMQVCDMVVDTSGAALWTTPEVAALLRSPHPA